MTKKAGVNPVFLMENEKIKIIKDISAAAGGFAILFWAVVMLVELSRLWSVVVGYE